MRPTAQTADLEVALGGQSIENAQPQKSSDSTGLGVIFALIVLGVLFGAVLAAVIPIVTALIAIGIGFAITGLMSHLFAVASFVPILGVLIGLGVGIGHALFIITRHRSGLRARVGASRRRRSTPSTPRGGRSSSRA